jgi:transcriptional regulator with XRE-family HTH domain
MQTAAEAGARLRALRKAAGLLQKDLARGAGCARCYISELESGKKLPSLALAGSLAANVGSTVVDVWWPPRPCGCGCGELTLGQRVEHHAAGSVTAALHREQFEKYLSRYGRRDIARAAIELGCSEGTVRNYVRDHPRLGSRYPGPWSGEKPWAFGNRDLEGMRRLLVENKQAAIDKTKSKWRRREIVRPRSGITVDCACGCGHAVYRSPSQLKSKSGLYFYSRSCRLRARWRGKTRRDREIVGKLTDGFTASDSWTPRGRQRVAGRLNGYRGAAAGVEGGRKGGPPRRSTPEQGRQMLELAERGLQQREIAAQVFGDPRYKDRVSRFLKQHRATRKAVA